MGYIYSSGSFKPSVRMEAPSGITLETSIFTSKFILAPEIGFELFIFDKISLGGEYTLGINFTSVTFEIKRKDQPILRQDGPSTTLIGFGTLGITLSVYF